MFRLLLIVAILCQSFILSAQTYYVDAARPDNTGAGTSWATAKKDLQAAIAVAGANSGIWVKAGTYLPTHDPFGNASPANNRDKTFMLKNGVKIYGGFAGGETQLSERNPLSNVTTLSGDLGVLNTLTDNAYHVVMSVNLSNTSLLDGFIITKGYATAPWQSRITVGARAIDRYKGGGIYNSYSAAVFSNCIIKANSADCTDMNDDAWGAGMVNEESSSVISDCVFDANSFLNGGASFGVYGAGMNILGGSCVLTRCYFVNNTSGSGFLDASRGGALYIAYGSTSITNCVFYNNSAQNGACIGIGGAENNLSSFANCTFAGNTSSYAGTAFSGFADAQFRNCIFWNNTPTSSSVANRNEIYSEESRTQYQPSFTNCIIRDAAGSPLTVTNTAATATLNGNPLFVNQADGDGPDNRWGTADDGLRLQCGSPALNAGTGVAPATDILGLPRSAALDIGAYEGGHVNSPVNALPAGSSIVQIGLNASGINYFSSCTSLVGAVQTGSPYTISGTATARVWIETIQPPQYVRRHYEITPQLNSTTATGRVTLYFTQQEFNDFNAVNTIKLPTGPADAAGIANIRIEKRGGTSSNSSGLPETYSGPVQTINNPSLSVVWNAAASRWEISFDVTGFSGFFVKTQLYPLPLHLLDFSVRNHSGCNLLYWQTGEEVNVREFSIEKSSNPTDFSAIGTKAAAGSGNNSYSFRDCAPTHGMAYYRLKMIDNDGQYKFSPVIRINNTAERNLTVFPNPAKDKTHISFLDFSLLNSKVEVLDVSAKLVKQVVLTSYSYVLDITALSPGMYLLRFSDGTTRWLLKRGG